MWKINDQVQFLFQEEAEPVYRISDVIDGMVEIVNVATGKELSGLFAEHVFKPARNFKITKLLDEDQESSNI